MLSDFNVILISDRAHSHAASWDAHVHAFLSCLAVGGCFSESLRTYMCLNFWQETSEYYVSFEEVLKAEVSHCHQVVVTKARGKKSGEESFAL